MGSFELRNFYSRAIYFTALGDAVEASHVDRVGYSLNHCQHRGFTARLEQKELKKVSDVNRLTNHSQRQCVHVVSLEPSQFVVIHVHVAACV